MLDPIIRDALRLQVHETKTNLLQNGICLSTCLSVVPQIALLITICTKGKRTIPLQQEIKKENVGKSAKKRKQSVKRMDKKQRKVY